MSDAPREVLKYDIDSTLVEQKIARIQQLNGQLTTARAGGQDTSTIEDALSREVAAMGKLTAGTEKSKDSLLDWSNKGEKSLKSMLGAINPELARMADLFLDVSEGAALMNGPLVAIAAIGAVIGTLSVAFNQVAASAEAAREAIQRTNAAVQEFHAQGARERIDLSSELFKVGAGGSAKEAQQVFDAVQRRLPGRDDLAKSAAVAAGIARANGEQFDLDQYLSGLAAGGFQAATFEPGKVGLSKLHQIMGAGSEARNRKALETFEGELRGGLNAPGTPTLAETAGQEVSPLEQALQQMFDNHPELSDKEKAAIGQVARSFRVTSPGKGLELLAAKNILGAGSYVGDALRGSGTSLGGLVPDIEHLPAAGGHLDLATLVQIVAQAFEEARKLGGGTEDRAAPSFEPVPRGSSVINNTTNIGTVIATRRIQSWRVGAPLSKTDQKNPAY